MLYELPVCAAPRLVDVIVSVLAAAAPTVIDSCADEVCTGDPPSFTDTVKFVVPFVVGVPEITPALERLRPAGKLPELIDHV